MLTSNEQMFACFCKSFSESLLQPIDVSHILKALEDRQTYCIALKENFELLDECLEVDVFEHPRFCDEFSHIMNRCLLASASLSLSLFCNQLMFHTILRL